MPIARSRVRRASWCVQLPPSTSPTVSVEASVGGVPSAGTTWTSDLEIAGGHRRPYRALVVCIRKQSADPPFFCAARSPPQESSIGAPGVPVNRVTLWAADGPGRWIAGGTHITRGRGAGTTVRHRLRLGDSSCRGVVPANACDDGVFVADPWTLTDAPLRAAPPPRSYPRCNRPIGAYSSTISAV